jgi:hypothetical protein
MLKSETNTINSILELSSGKLKFLALYNPIL